MNNEIKLYDDFLPREEFESLQNLMLGDCFPWFFNRFTTYDPSHGEDAV